MDQRSPNGHQQLDCFGLNQKDWDLLKNGCHAHCCCPPSPPAHHMMVRPPGIKPHDSRPLMLMLTEGETPKESLKPSVVSVQCGQKMGVGDLPLGFHNSFIDHPRSAHFLGNSGWTPGWMIEEEGLFPSRLTYHSISQTPTANPNWTPPPPNSEINLLNRRPLDWQNGRFSLKDFRANEWYLVLLEPPVTSYISYICQLLSGRLDIKYLISFHSDVKYH